VSASPQETASTPAARLERRLEELRASRAYAAYERARAAVLTMKLREGELTGAPSAYWREELENIEYLLDASPLVVDRLRQHCYHVTGVWPYNYRSHKTRERRRHAEKLAALAAVGGHDLFVPESPLLGGFGFEIDGALVNLDTLKFYESLIALRRAGLLELLEAGGRAVVWEIGAGWGGFAYQLKTLFPNVTYVISDLPELFLISGTYLATAFPDATLVFFGQDATDPADVPWPEADFVFVPGSLLSAVAPPRVDLTVNMVSFQEMTAGQVEAYTEHAYSLGCPHLYSLNRDRSPYNPELTSVRETLAQRYALTTVPVLPVSYTKMLDRQPSGLRRALRRAGSVRPARPGDYVHVVGKRREGL
jgi:hypothetical protein